MLSLIPDNTRLAISVFVRDQFTDRAGYSAAKARFRYAATRRAKG